MSTKSSLAMAQWQTQHEIHIYKEMIDDCYYLETEDERIKIPENYAKKFAEIIKKEEEQNENCN